MTNRAGQTGMKVSVALILSIALLAGACHKAPVRPVIIAPPVPSVPVTPPPVPVPPIWPELPLPPTRLPPPPEPPLPRNFRDGEASFQSGKYADAVHFYDRFIREDPITEYKDVAMFKLAMSLALECTSPDCHTKSMEKSMEQFKRVVAQFPKSPYSAEARFILSLRTDIEKMKADVKSRDDKIKKLTDELERLKKIDLKRRK